MANCVLYVQDEEGKTKSISLSDQDKKFLSAPLYGSLRENAYCASLSVLAHIDFVGGERATIREEPVELSDVCSGFFLKSSSFNMSLSGISNKYPGLDEAEYSRFLGKCVVEELEQIGFIENIGMPADDWTTWSCYRLTNLGKEFISSFRKGDTEYLGASKLVSRKS